VIAAFSLLPVLQSTPFETMPQAYFAFLVFSNLRESRQSAFWSSLVRVCGLDVGSGANLREQAKARFQLQQRFESCIGDYATSENFSWRRSDQNIAN
jgi:hypothetical protein